MLRLPYSTAVLMACLLIACATRQPGTPVTPGFNLFSKSQDIELGREASAQVRRQSDVVQDSRLQAYISNIGTKLASQPGTGNFPYQFTLLNDNSINAFALPGGPVYVNTGLLKATQNEAQLAGVLAHEISHVALRHGTSQVSKANVVQIPAVLASAAVGQQTLLGQLAQVGISVGAGSLLLSYSREAEREADALGARLMAQAGYDPAEMARFFQILEAQGGQRAPEFLSSHPSPGNRLRLIQQEIRFIPQRQYTADTGQFKQMQQLAAQLPPPNPQRRLQSRSAPPANPTRPGAPSADFQHVQTSRYELVYPSNWQAFADSESAMLAVAPPEGLLPNQQGLTTLAYGAIVNYYFPRRKGVDLERATNELVARLSAANPAIQIATRQPGKITVDGCSALVTHLASSSPYGGIEREVLVTVERPEGVFYFLFAAPEDGFDGLQPVYEKMLTSIRFRS
jgi:Putative Zn-dependent protease, contains TPR repeats